jgi:ferritin-like metal-binding protein YciE
MSTDIQKQLVKHLADVHSIEEQALAQLRRAPEIAGDAKLASIFEQHLAETERQEKRVRGRLEAHGAEPSKLKDVLGKAGAIPMILFARLNPDTPGKLLDHAYSYEHMELAAYEILGRVAERAGDADTVSTARDIAAEEREMARRLEDGFDAAVAASLRDQNPDDLDEQLNSYLADAHAIEKQVISLLQAPRRSSLRAGWRICSSSIWMRLESMSDGCASASRHAAHRRAGSRMSACGSLASDRAGSSPHSPTPSRS